MSNQTRNPPNPPNTTNPAQKSTDSTPTMVGGGSSPLKIEISGSVDGFKYEKLIFNRPNRKTNQNFCSPPIGVVSRSDFVRSVEIQWDLIEIWPDLFEIHQDLLEISPNLFKIH